MLEQTLKVLSRRQTRGHYLATAELPDSGTIKSKVLQTESVQWNRRRRFGRRDIVLPNLWSIHGSQKSWGLLFRGLANSCPFLFSAHANWTRWDFNFVLFSHHNSSNHRRFQSWAAIVMAWKWKWDVRLEWAHYFEHMQQPSGKSKHLDEEKLGISETRHLHSPLGVWGGFFSVL